MNPARWSLRLRVFLFFALIALGAAVGIVGALVYVAHAAEPATTAPLALAGLIAVGVTVGLTSWVWLKFDEHVARPLVAIASDVRAAVHARAARKPPSIEKGRYLGVLAPAVAEFTAALDEARLEVDAAVATATAEAERERRNLEIVLRDLRQGVVICTLSHKVTLYNRRAQEILGASGEIGLDRPLTEVLSGRVLGHTLERLEDRFRTGRHQIHRDGLTTTLVGATATENARIVGRMTLMLDADGARPTGYILSFEDVTNALAAGVWRDRILQDSVHDMRERVAALALAGDLLARTGDPDPQDVAFARDLLLREPAELGERPRPAGGRGLRPRLRRMADGDDAFADAVPADPGAALGGARPRLRERGCAGVAALRFVLDHGAGRASGEPHRGPCRRRGLPARRGR